MHVSKWSLPALLVTTVLSIASFAATPDRIQTAIDSSRTVPLSGSVHPKAQAKYDQGAVDASFPLNSISLATVPSDAQEKALDRFLLDLQNPKSPHYHKGLTPAQFGERFGLSQNDLNRLIDWLTSEGFVIQSVGAGRNRIVFSGTASLVKSAFKAEIHRYNVNGEEHFANSTPIMIPTALQGIISGMIGFTDFRPHPANRYRLTSLSREQPYYYDGKFIFPNFLSPGDLRTIYDIPSTLTGQNQKLAIMGQTDIFAADINDFRSAFGLSAISCTSAPTGVISACSDSHFKYILVGSDPTQEPDSISAGDIGEADLDLEWSGAVAFQSQIVYVNSPDPNGNGTYSSLAYTLDPPTGTAIPAYVVSMSYGGCEVESGGTPSAIGYLEPFLKQGAAEMITVVNSSGDSGAAACDGAPSNSVPPFTPAEGGLGVSYPASSWYVVAAGGASISLADDSVPTVNTTYWGTTNGTSGGTTFGQTAQQYIPEIPWNDAEQFAEYCTTISGASQAFCDPPGQNPPQPGVKITSALTAQEDYWIGSGGGGASNCFTQSAGVCAAGNPQPSWQSSLKLPTTPPGASGVRWVPDISLHASPDFAGFIYCTPQNPDASTPIYTSTCANGIDGSNGAVEKFNSIVGGTSASSPIFAAILTLLNESLNTPSGSGLGDIHQTLYNLAATANHGNGAFHPITTGDNLVYCEPSTPSGQPSAIQCPAGASDGPIGYLASNADPTTGYNLVTGLGSVDVAKFVSAWAASDAPEFSLAGSTTPTSFAAGTSTTATVTVTPASGATLPGSMSFACSGLPQGITCGSFSTMQVSNNTGTTTVTISVAPNVVAGSPSLTVTGTCTSSCPSGSSSATTTVSFSVTASTETFTLTSNLASGTLSVKQGQTGQVNLTVNSTNGFTTGSGGNTTTVVPLTYTCSSSPAITLSNCTFSPTSPNQSTAVTVSISTTAPTNAQALPLDRGSRILYAALFPGLFGIVFVGISRRRSLRGIRMLGLICVLGASTLWMGSCGGSNNSSNGTPGTPTGSYTVTVNATTGGSGPISNSYQFTLTVTQ